MFSNILYGGYPDEPALNEFLKQDPVFLQNQNDLSRQMDNLETREDKEMLDMLKKTEHLFKMIGFMLKHTAGGEDHLPSKFFNYSKFFKYCFNIHSFHQKKK